jgi:hypothetical protein
MNENRQIFVNTYLTNGYNATQAYKTAYPNCKSGQDRAGHRLLSFDEIKKAISKAKEELQEWLNAGRELCDKLFQDQYKDSVTAKDRTNAIRCVENKAKNVGYYALDNAQRQEQAKLDKTEVIELQRIANILNFESIKRGKAG